MTPAEEAKEILDGAEAQQEFFRPEGELRALADDCRTLVVTAAQNNTSPNGAALETFKTYADHFGGELKIIPIRYKNPTSRLDPQEEDARARRDADYWWHDDLLPYLAENDWDFHRKLRVMGRVRIQATAINPLGGLDGMSGDLSAIYAHPQVQMRTVPTARDYPKVLHTTGAVTEKNYSQTKQGYAGEFHHTFGAVVVHKDDSGHFFMRHLNYSERHGTACDLDLEFSPGRVRRLDRVPAIITGDEHAVWIHPDVLRATYESPESMVQVLYPHHLVRHDVLDSYSISRHHLGDYVRQVVKRAHGYDDVRWELEQTRDLIDRTTPRGTQNVIVASNHHEHLLQWLNRRDARENPTNAILYHRLMVEVLERAIEAGPGQPDQDAFKVWAEVFGDFQSATRFLARNENFRLLDVELGYHGDAGPNGSRGTPRAFSRLGTRMVGGHIHGPCIEKGARFVGCSVGPLEYLRGPSNWLHAHAILHPNGKVQIVPIVGWWRERL